MKNSSKKYLWKKFYTWILIANTAYILLFYWLMKLFENGGN